MMRKVSGISRRKFIQTAAMGMAGMKYIPGIVSGVAPSDRVRVAVIGLGNQGRAHMNWFNALPDVEVAALCDLDKLRVEEARKQLQKINPGSRAEIYHDFRHVIDRKDIDAIACATPDHWHALIATMAFSAGKDVYGEKPLSYTLREGQAMLASLVKNKSVFQLGTQIHAGENFHRVAEIIQAGILGKIHTVRLWKTGGSPGLGFPPNQKPPDTLDWNLWLGPAPWAEYTPVRCHGSYRYFLDYSGGVFADFWSIADILFMSVLRRDCTVLTEGKTFDKQMLLMDEADFSSVILMLTGQQRLQRFLALEKCISAHILKGQGHSMRYKRVQYI